MGVLREILERVVGVVLKDSNGHLVVAFSSLRAEALVVLLGLKLCFEKGFDHVFVQSNSLLLVSILQRLFHYPWNIRREVEQIWQMVSDASRFLHCYR